MFTLIVNFLNQHLGLKTYGSKRGCARGGMRDGEHLLAGLMDADRLVGRVHLNLISGRQKRVEADNQVGVAFEERRHARNYARRVDPGGKVKCLERTHIRRVTQPRLAENVRPIGLGDWGRERPVARRDKSYMKHQMHRDARGAVTRQEGL